MYTISVVLIGVVLLLLYVVIDFIKNKTKNILNRVLFYSFIFYMLIVCQLTTGGIMIPPEKGFTPDTQLIPFYFSGELLSMYQADGFDWHFWNSLKLTFFNFIMLMPLGVYLSILFQVKKKLNALLIILFISLTIETMQFSFTYFGLIYRGFNVDDIIINTLGGFLAFVFCQFLKGYDFDKYLFHNKDKDM